MADLSDMREGLAANLAGVAGLQQSAYLLANPTPPCAEVQPAETNYDEAFARGLDRWTFTVRVFVGATTDIGAQKALDRMLNPTGASSIKAALESDRTLDGSVDDLQVTSCSGYRIYSREGAGAMLGAEWTVVVLATP